MVRSWRRLEEHALGNVPGANLDDGLDPLYHFVQDAYHLKDWIKKDPATENGSGQLIECVRPVLQRGEEQTLPRALCGTGHHASVR